MLKVTLLFTMIMILETQCSMKNMKDLINKLISDGEIGSEMVVDVMLKVDRGDFCSTNRCYENEDQDIGYNAKINAPSVHATVLEVLENHLKRPRRNVLNIGFGSGYLTVCMGLMLGRGGNITAIERSPHLVELATTNTKKHHADILTNGTIKFLAFEGNEGYLANSPYDVIYTSEILHEIPFKIIKNQLKAFGRFVGAIGNTNEESYLTIVDKDDYGKLVINNMSRLSIIPLPNK